MSKTFLNDTSDTIYLANLQGRCVRLKPGEQETVHESMVNLCTNSPLTLVKAPAAVASAKPIAKPTKTAAKK